MALLIRSVGRQTCLLKQVSLMTPRRSTMATTAYEEMAAHWTKNRALNRPISPFLTVYKPHLAMMTSLTHRITGVVMQVVLCGGSIILLCVPGNFKDNLEKVKQFKIATPLIVALKYIMAFPVVYHFLNGIRHLSWDAGYGFPIKTLYKSAYFVMALTFIVTTVFVFGIKPDVLEKKSA